MNNCGSICKFSRFFQRLIVVTGLAFLGFTQFTNAQTNAFPHGKFVINAGIGGNTTINMLKRIRKDCLNFKPDPTIVMAGTNDINSAKYVALSKYRINLEHLQDSIQASGSKILLMNMLPFYTPYLLTRHQASFYEPNGTIVRQAEVNRTVASIASEPQIPFLDIHHYFEKAGDIGLDKSSLIRNMENSGLTDGIHPTAEGYRLIAALVCQKLITDGLPHQRVVCFGDSITKGDGGTKGKNYPAYLKRLLEL